MSPTRVLVLVGTRKGAFVFESDPDRKEWRTSGPHFPGWSLTHMKYDHRNAMLYAALTHDVYGSNIHRSADLGQNWQMVDGPHYPEGDESP